MLDMPRTVSVIERALQKFRFGNIAIASAICLMPLVLAIGFLTDREHLPGHGISARAGLQASLEAAAPATRG
jgi:hypothetical protein